MKSRTTLSKLAPLAAAALAASAANAQTAATPSSVTLYGIVDACLVSHRAETGAQALVNGGGCFYGSRFGFRGKEDLGGGLRAYFGLEAGFAADTGKPGQGGRAFGRRSTVGLGGNFGAVELGRELPPGHFLISPVDPQKLGIGSASATLWTGAPSTASGRVDNGLIYLTPAFRGVTARLLFAPGEQGGALASRGGDTKGLNVLYSSKSLLAGVAYASVRNAAATAEDTATTLGAKYDFGTFSLAALAQFGRWEGSRTEAAPSSATALYSRDYHSYVVGGTLRLGGDSLSATYKRYDDRTAPNFDATVWSAVYIHPLSKRTQIYTGVSRLKNRGASSYGVADGNGAYTGTAAGGSSSIVDLGITHFF